MRPHQHPLDRGEVARGVLAALSDRRAEAHLWLLLEEALASVRATGTDGTFEARRDLRAVADALVAVGAVSRRVADAIAAELDDAFAVRGLAPMSSFTGRAFPAEAAVHMSVDAAVTRDRTVVWLETEIERHLDLLASFDPAGDPGAGAVAVGIVGRAVRGLTAAGAMTPAATTLLAEFGASVAAAGFSVPTGEVPARPAWVRFLARRPPPLAFGDGGDDLVELRQPVGEIAGRAVTVSSLAWSARMVEVRLSVRTPPGVAAGDRAAWAARLTDLASGDVHLGQPQLATSDGAAYVVVRLRPGFEVRPASGAVFTVRIASGGDAAEARLVFPS